MDRFQLTNDLLTGIDTVDSQHRMLFDLANQIVDPSSERGADAAFFASLAFLAEYVEFHFASEELAMTQTDYPMRAGHVAAHLEFRELVGEFLERSLEEPSITELRKRLTQAVAGWLTDHIRVKDRALATHLRAHAGEVGFVLPDQEALISAGYIQARTDWPKHQ